MTHRTPEPRRLTLSALTLASLLFAMHGGCAIHARQQKSDDEVQPGAKLLPGAPQTPDPRRKPAAQLPPSILVRWQGRPGVNRYRLQLATEERFADVVFDRAVEGRQYVVKDLPPGNYFWRVAPAAAETSPSYSRPVSPSSARTPPCVATMTYAPRRGSPTTSGSKLTAFGFEVCPAAAVS